MPTDFRLCGRAVVLTDIDDTMLPLTKPRATEELSRFLEKLRFLGIEVIPVTFKTVVELEVLMSELRHDFIALIAEGGCLMHAVKGLIKTGGLVKTAGVYDVIELCRPISHYEALLTRIEEDPRCFGRAVRLSNADSKIVSQLTGLPVESVRASQTRRYSDAFITRDVSCRDLIIDSARGAGLNPVQTRRAVHLLEGSKEEAVVTLLKGMNTPGRRLAVIGMGDNEADEGILRHVDAPVVVSGEDAGWLKRAQYVRSLEEPPRSWMSSLRIALSWFGMYIA
ncbi:MAG: HAD-IIB family hydrolase [Zestosphaera sp.]